MDRNTPWRPIILKKAGAFPEQSPTELTDAQLACALDLAARWGYGNHEARALAGELRRELDTRQQQQADHQAELDRREAELEQIRGGLAKPMKKPPILK